MFKVKTFYDAKELWTIKKQAIATSLSRHSTIFIVFEEREKKIKEMEGRNLELLKMQKNY